MATVAKAPSKKALAVGDWVEFIKGHDGARKGQFAVIATIDSEMRDWSKDYGEDGSFTEGYGLVYMDANGDSQYTNVFKSKAEKILKSVKAPEYVVAWSTEDMDPFTYAGTRAEADKLVARKRVYGDKVVEARVFKAVK